MIPIGKCCFVVPLKPAVMIIGLAFTAVSFTGLLLSTSSVLQFLHNPADPLLRWLLQVCYFLDIHGVAFHAVLFIVSTLLVCGVVSNVTPLLVPWLAASPLFVVGILIQMILVILKQPELALPVVSFCMMVLLFVIYATLVVAAYYKQVSMSTIQLRIFNIREGELPRIVEIPQNSARPFFQRREAPATSSMQPLQDGPTRSTDVTAEEKWPKLSHAYARFMRVNRLSKNAGHPSAQDTHRF